MQKIFFAPFLNKNNGVKIFSDFFLNGISHEFEILTTIDNSFYYNRFGSYIKKSALELVKLIYKSNVIYVSCWHNIHSLFVILISILLRKKIIFISHGVSLIGYYFSLKEFARTVIGIFYIIIIIFLTPFFSKVILVCPKNIIDKKRFLDIYIYRLFCIPYSRCSFTDYAIFFKKNILTVDHNNNYIKNCISLIGYYSHIKNQLLFIKIAEKFPEYKFVILGKKEGSYYSKCVNYIKSNKIVNVYLIDEKDCTTQTLLKNTICLISCSRTESFGLVLLEASLFNIPIISTSTGIALDVNAIFANSLEEFIIELTEVLGQ